MTAQHEGKRLSEVEYADACFTIIHALSTSAYIHAWNKIYQHIAWFESELAEQKQKSVLRDDYYDHQLIDYDNSKANLASAEAKVEEHRTIATDSLLTDGETLDLMGIRYRTLTFWTDDMNEAIKRVITAQDIKTRQHLANGGK